MKPAYILITLSLAISACGLVRGPMAATAAALQTPAPTAAPATSTVPAPTAQPSPPATEAPPTQPATPEAQPTAPVLDLDASARQLLETIVAHAGRVRRNVTYCTVDGIELKMDLYSPRSVTGATPLVIFIHGGGWSEGDKVGGEYLLDTPALLDAGFSVTSLNYRMAPDYPFPAMIEDVKCAVRSFRAHAGDYQIEPDNIAVWGTSAGGHLVNMLGTTDTDAGFDVGEYLEQSSRVQAVLDMFGPADLKIDFSSAFVELKDSVFGGFDLARASPVTYVTADDPPFLILQGDRDPVVPLVQSQTFYDSLTAAGVDAQLVVVQGGGHGFRTLNISPSRAELSAMIIEFFEAHLK